MSARSTGAPPLLGGARTAVMMGYESLAFEVFVLEGHLRKLEGQSLQFLDQNLPNPVDGERLAAAGPRCEAMSHVYCALV